jgi:hypothetical protein
MFTTNQRDAVRERVLAIARSDPRVTAGALTGSTAVGAEDQWSDIDVAFGIADGNSLGAVLDDWTAIFRREFGALHHWDLPAGASIYRVFLLPTGLEIDVGVTPQGEFGPRGPHFRTLFGSLRPLASSPPPSAQYLIGLGWHHVLHAQSSIARAQPWHAEFLISGVRDHTLALACLRLGEESFYGRGIDRLPATLTDPFAGTLVRSLDEPELRRALAVVTECLIRELDAWDPALCTQLSPLLQEFGAPQPPPAGIPAAPAGGATGLG